MDLQKYKNDLDNSISKSIKTEQHETKIWEDEKKQDDDLSVTTDTTTSDDSEDDDMDLKLESEIQLVSDEYMSDDSEDECAVFLCNECGKKFNNAASLKAHLAKKHNPRALVNCELCDSKYRGDFSEHLDSEHGTVDGGYFCKKCKFVSADFEGMIKHRHDKDLLNVCKYCGKMYKLKENYKLHLLIHKNDESKKKKEQTFNCEICGKKFLFAYLLKEHINLHTSMKQHPAPNNSVRPFKCLECKRSFNRNGDLKKHMRCHSNGVRPYVCDVCGDCFSQSIHLRTHSSIHLEVRYHTCNYCNKSYKKRGDLVKHIRIHTEEQSYNCAKCEVSFKQSFELANHNEKCHASVSTEMQQASVPLAV